MRVEIDLPVCPVCGHVGKYPGGGSLTFNCTGPAGAMHKRTRMVRQRFQAVGEGVKLPSTGREKRVARV